MVTMSLFATVDAYAGRYRVRMKRGSGTEFMVVSVKNLTDKSFPGFRIYRD